MPKVGERGIPVPLTDSCPVPPPPGSAPTTWGSPAIGIPRSLATPEPAGGARLPHSGKGSIFHAPCTLPGCPNTLTAHTHKMAASSKATEPPHAGSLPVAR